MASRLDPSIGFTDDARQALEFYRAVFGGELRMNTFGEFGSQDSPDANKIMHGQLETPSGFTLTASDTPEGIRRNCAGPLHEGDGPSAPALLPRHRGLRAPALDPGWSNAGLFAFIEGPRRLADSIPYRALLYQRSKWGRDGGQLVRRQRGYRQQGPSRLDHRPLPRPG